MYYKMRVIIHIIVIAQHQEFVAVTEPGLRVCLVQYGNIQ